MVVSVRLNSSQLVSVQSQLERIVVSTKSQLSQLNHHAFFFGEIGETGESNRVDRVFAFPVFFYVDVDARTNPEPPEGGTPYF